jgi:hypothetical protein
MSQTSFEQDIFINAIPEKVNAFLSTLENHIQIHPFIVSIRHIQTQTASDGSSVKHYVIRDRMKQGPFTITFSYQVETSTISQGVVVSDAHQFPAIYLHNTTMCIPEGDGTRVKERVEITAPYLMINTVYTQALASHKDMFKKLKTILE